MRERDEISNVDVIISIDNIPTTRRHITNQSTEEKKIPSPPRQHLQLVMNEHDRKVCAVIPQKFGVEG